MPPKLVQPPPPPPLPVGDEEEECVSNKDVRAVMKVLIELFTKNKQSIDKPLERVECSMARIIDRVDALETGLPTIDQGKLPNDTHEDDHNHNEQEEVDDEEPINPPRPPPRWPHRDDQQVHQELPRPPRLPNWQGMGGHPHRGPNQ
jgi:hypothetical protein